MGASDDDRRAAELEAFEALWNLWRAARGSDVENWESACRMLQTYYTVAKARQDSEVCAMRIRYLEISEPSPRLEDFVHAPPHYRLPDAPPQLAQARHEYQLARLRHPERERQRLNELETTKRLYRAIKAVEENAALARRREWQQSRWPKGVVLDSDVYRLYGVAAQVDRQNAKIESHVQALTDLFRAGLQNLADAPASDVAASYRAGEPEAIAAHAESALMALPLPRGIKPKAKVGYSADLRQLVVEYELPTVDVVPTVKSYRYVKSRETVVATARPPSQVKALYASTIAQLTLLSLAVILGSDSEHHMDVVVFHGVVDTRDPRNGQPIRPCLISVRVTPDTFAEIDPERLDPSGCLQQLSATVSRNPARCVPVRPLSE